MDTYQKIRQDNGDAFPSEYFSIRHQYDADAWKLRYKVQLIFRPFDWHKEKIMDYIPCDIEYRDEEKHQYWVWQFKYDPICSFMVRDWGSLFVCAYAESYKEAEEYLLEMFENVIHS